MTPWGTRRTLVVRGYQGIRVTIEVQVRRGHIWVVSIDPPFSSTAILEPTQADNLVALLTQATTEARGYHKDTAT